MIDRSTQNSLRVLRDLAKQAQNDQITLDELLAISHYSKLHYDIIKQNRLGPSPANDAPDGTKQP